MKRFAHLLSAVLLSACVSIAAHADSITFTVVTPPPFITVPPGSGVFGQDIVNFVIPFTATVSAAATNTGNIYVNNIGNGGNFNGFIDNGPLLQNFAGVPIAPGQSLTGVAFNLDFRFDPYYYTNFFLPTSFTPVEQFGNFGIVLGGSTPTAQNVVLASGVQALAAVQIAAAPEPPAWVLAAIGLVLLLLVKGRVWVLGRRNASVSVAG